MILLFCPPALGIFTTGNDNLSYCKLSTKIWGQPVESTIDAREVIAGYGQFYCLDSRKRQPPKTFDVKLTIIAPFGAGFLHDENFEIDLFTFVEHRAKNLLGIYFFSDSFAQIPLGDKIEFLFVADPEKSFGPLNINIRAQNGRANLIKQTLKNAFLSIAPGQPPND